MDRLGGVTEKSQKEGRERDERGMKVDSSRIEAACLSPHSCQIRTTPQWWREALWSWPYRSVLYGDESTIPLTIARTETTPRRNLATSSRQHSRPNSGTVRGIRLFPLDVPLGHFLLGHFRTVGHSPLKQFLFSDIPLGHFSLRHSPIGHSPSDIFLLDIFPSVIFPSASHISPFSDIPLGNFPSNIFRSDILLRHSPSDIPSIGNSPIGYFLPRIFFLSNTSPLGHSPHSDIFSSDTFPSPPLLANDINLQLGLGHGYHIFTFS